MLLSGEPVGPMPCWSAYIAAGNTPKMVEAKTNAGGIFKGGQFQSFGTDRTGQFYAIWNSAGNAVWCHKSNFREVSDD